MAKKRARLRKTGRKKKPGPKAARRKRPTVKPKTKPKAKAKAGQARRKKFSPPPRFKAVKEPLVPVLPASPERPPARKAAKSKGRARGSVLSAGEIEEVRHRLLERREDLQSEVGAEPEPAGVRPRSADPTDQASDAADDALNMALVASESDEISQIDAALERIENGEFGICEECGQSIPAERLKTLPYATTCIDCKRRQETALRKDGLEEAWEKLDEAEEEPAEEE